MILIKKRVLEANRWIVEKKLVELTWGNVSYCDRTDNLVYIKPSGVKLSLASVHDISCIDFEGEKISGLKGSVDTPTHIELYKAFPRATCIIHTHSKYATIFAQAQKSIPCIGTTHADYFYGEIPCVSSPNASATQAGYEKHTGIAIQQFYKEHNLSYSQMPACLVGGHGPFVWGKSIDKALENAYVLEIVAEYAYKSMLLGDQEPLRRHLLDKHFLRKHGSDKYYGQ